MRRGKADRFERLADKSWHNWEAAVTPTRIAQLLRHEHWAVLRRVRAERRKYSKHTAEWIVLSCVLYILNRRAR